MAVESPALDLLAAFQGLISWAAGSVPVVALFILLVVSFLWAGVGFLG